MEGKGGERGTSRFEGCTIALPQNAVWGHISHASFLKKTADFILRSKGNVFVLT